jgi:flagellar biosynthetic protein FlhB
MAEQDAQDRNLPASAKKIRRAREQGQVPRSRDLGHFASLSVATLLAFALLPALTAYLQHLVGDGLRFDTRVLETPQASGEHAIGLFMRGLQVVMIVGAVMGSVGVAASLALGGWNFTLKAVSPDFTRMNPISGLGRLFNKQQLVNTLKACLLAGVVGAAGVWYLQSHVADLNGALSAALPTGIAHVASTVGGGLVILLVVLGLWAAVDVPLQKWQFATRLKMSREEVKQEQKESEGNVEVKGKIKAKMRQLARRRMMTAVPKADIVVMNPTHYAVALKYDEEAGGAPRVVAKGTDRLAFRIRDLAVESHVPVLQAPPLARALYAHVELEQEVPAQLFAAVAQVLAWVFQVRRHPTLTIKPPEVSVPDELDPLVNPAAGRPVRPGRRPPKPSAGPA